MTRGRVVRVAGFVDLVPIRELERDLAAQHVAPVRALAAVVGEALEERRRVDRLAERLEADRVAVELVVATLHHTHVLDARSRSGGNLRHVSSSQWRSIAASLPGRRLASVSAAFKRGRAA